MVDQYINTHEKCVTFTDIKRTLKEKKQPIFLAVTNVETLKAIEMLGGLEL